MAVKHVETFTFELPLAVVEVRDHGWGEVPDDNAVVDVTMDRAALDQLWDDIGVALGKGRRGAAEYREPGTSDEEAIFLEPHPGTERLSVEEAAAQAQIAAKQAERMQHLANPNQPRGSAIGNRHT